jgi:glycosyltransferase involved in cell wall biosynthesis
MRVLAIHNFYQQPGGEDQVFRDETRLLELHGHEVIRFTLHNDQIADMSRLQLAADTMWNRRVSGRLENLMDRARPHVAHFTNTFPLISPAAYRAVRRRGAAVVQTLQNYRLLCPNALFLRGQQVCEDCAGKAFAWPGVMHACYRGSRTASLGVATMLSVHRAAGTWRRDVDVYVPATGFAAEKFAQAGLPAERIMVKPNFVDPDPEPGAGRGGYAVFVGRLAPEKGLPTLLEAWSMMDAGTPLKIVGDGPLADLVKDAAARMPSVQWLGRRPLEEVYRIVGDAAVLIFPSIWYEGMPKTILESLAKGTPVIASRIGAMAEMIDHGRIGLHFAPGSAAELAQQVQAAFSGRIDLGRMRGEARREFEMKYTPEQNYRRLREIYAAAMARRNGRQAERPPADEAWAPSS